MFKPLRKLYDWVLHWAHTPYGTPALILNSFAESSFFPIPPDVLLIALSVSRRKKALLYAFLTTVASVLGGILGYYIGYALMEAVGWPIIKFYHKEEVFAKLIEMFRDNSFLAVLIAALTPIPYKVFTIAAGASSSPFGVFVVASLLGRALRFMALGVLIYIFGERIKTFIDKYFNLLTVLFMVLFIIGVICIKLFVK
ncbi:MAG: DedA family protein [Candidatus Auribacter fodinae]|jgi:membrane protein YqaA with SNARE-associated domain|uniref:DedA family protein n=1 Tax=Candidatus Auribacter fodinae TaxID=2093366 RepID=A0A3A4R3Z6_9BACT|nr:MAG: DedA family protein [Candidatus Auribacter fodinae]